MKKLIPIVAMSLLSVTLMNVANATDVEKKQQEVNEKQIELNQETIKESIDKAHASNVSMQQVSRASKIIGTPVKNSKDENLGDIKELVIDPENGQVVYAVVSFGGVFGVGDKLFAVPWRVLHWTASKKYYAIDLDKETLKKAPGFDKKHWPDSSSKWDQQREEIDQFYRITH